MFEELDYQITEMGELILRRRRSLAMPGTIVYEVKLDGAFLMSSLVRASEEALADIPLAGRGDERLTVLVGGLGLGHTAAAALQYPNVAHVDVVEFLTPVIDWHNRRLVPAADTLLDDSRCSLIAADFFDSVRAGDARLMGVYDAILLDIDHSPEAVLDSGHNAFYSQRDLTHLKRWLNPGGVFALWSAERPGEAFIQTLQSVFISTAMYPVSFTNPNFSRPEENWVIVAESAAFNAKR
jgi:spermidine synthase